MKKVSKGDFARLVTPIHGSLRKVPVTLFSIIRNEIYFLLAWLDHYRALGVEQFLILDDGSDDGSAEFLARQPDCVVLSSELRFGEQIMVDRGWLRPAVKARAEVWLKQMIPDVFLSEQWHVYVDADEFLLLPERLDCLQSLVHRLDGFGERAVAGPMLEFYPERVSDMRVDAVPESFDELVGRNPFFDRGPLIEPISCIKSRPKSPEGPVFIGLAA